jgi:predicted ATPase/DNA-binding CsgD family transcriptional regulator
MKLPKSKGGRSRGKRLIVGRQAELTLITRLLDAARHGTGCVIGISGEPGIGKTTLAEAAGDAAQKQGYTILWGQCHDGQYIPPYWPWKEPLKRLLSVFPSPRGKSSLKGIREGLASIVSETNKMPRASKAMPRPMSYQTRLRILESATALIRTVSERRPLLLIMDNLHCADVPSLQLLEVVAREMQRQNVVIVGSYRDPVASSNAELRQLIGGLASQALFHPIALTGLDEAAISDYLKSMGIPEAPRVLAQTVLDRTEGNPLFVAEVTRLLKSKGLVNVATVEEIGVWAKEIPHKVRLAIQDQVRRLSPSCKDVVSAAALSGREFESWLLGQTIPSTTGAIAQGLEEAVAQGIAAESETPGVYKFTHALIQAVIVEEIPTARRSALHLKIGKVLEGRYRHDLEAHAGELARHFDSGGLEGLTRALQYYRIAGERALRMHGFEDALGQFGRAAHLDDGTVGAPDSAKILVGLAQSQHGVGKWKEAIGTYTRAFDLYERSGDFENAIRILEQPLILAEEGADATGLFERAIALAGAQTLRGEALGGKYGLAIYRATGDYRRAATLFDRALRATRESGDRSQEIAAIINRGRIEYDELHFEEAHRLEQEGYRLAREVGDIWLELNALDVDAESLLGLGRLAEAEPVAHLLRATADRMHWPTWTSVAPRLLCAVQRQGGDLASARESNQAAMALQPNARLNHVQKALLDFEQGLASAGRESLSRAGETVHSAPLLSWGGSLTVLIPLIAWITGEPVRLESAENAAVELSSSGSLRRGEITNINTGRGLIAVIRKDGDAAKKHYSALFPLRGVVISPEQGIAADHLLALLSSTIGDQVHARDHFNAAVGFCRTGGLKVELAYTCRDFAQFLVDNGDENDAAIASACCEEATAIASQSGLPRLLDRLGQLREQIGSQPVSPGYPDSLSEREVDVLRLLAEGLSNAQIGDRLFISLHTVASHVQKILEKTRTANRTEAAMYAVRFGLKGTKPPPA